MNSFKRVHGFHIELEFEVLLVFDERGKPEYLTGQGREPITNSTHMWL